MVNFNFKKKYGQNFLQNENVLNNIAESFSVKDNDKIIEIGPGSGALTKKLVKLGCDVTCFEIDVTLKKFLDNIDSKRLKVIYDDFLNIRLSDYFSYDDSIFVAANLPYYITTPIINKFLSEKYIPDCMVLMVQKEVAERFSSKPHKSEYGAFTVILNYYFDVEYLFTVGREDFYPVPNVDSAVVRMIKKENRYNVKNYDMFEKLVYDSFKHKRKNLKNNLSNYNLVTIDSVLNKHGLSISNRAEELSCEIFVEIVNNL